MNKGALKYLYIQLLKRKRGLFFSFCCLYFLLTYKDFVSVAKLRDGDKVFNSDLILNHQIWLVCWFVIFLLSYLNRVKALHRISLFVLFPSILYGIRLTQAYLFQDDWYHTLAITRLNWKGFWIPFVDHVTPIWRFLQWTLLNTFGGLSYMKVLPYFGVLGMAFLAEILFRILYKKAKGIAFLASLAFLTFPGYAAILFWISTDAITFSAIFGVLGLWIQNQITDKNRNRSLVLMTVLFSLSHLTWTTGLVFPIFSVGWFVLRDFDWKQKAHIVKRSHWPLFIPGILTLVIFYIIRKTIFSIYTEDVVTNILWVANGTRHGHEPNILRPLLWPFIAIFDGTIVRGIFGKIYGNTYFAEPLLRGVLFAYIFIFAKQKNLKIIKNNLIIFSFLFISFAVVFLGRGIGPVGHKSPQGYVDFAIANDWYRISGLAGALFLWGLGFQEYSKKVRRYIKLAICFVVLPLFLGIYGITGQFRDHFIRILSTEVSKQYEEAHCLNRVNLGPDEWYIASEFVMAPMFRSNPGNYWLSYEPSWFDLYLKPYSVPNARSEVFDVDKYTKVLNAVKTECAEFLENHKKYVLRADFPALEWSNAAVPIKLKSEAHESQLKLVFDIDPVQGKDLRLFSLLVFKFKVLEPFKLEKVTTTKSEFSAEFIGANLPVNSELIITMDNRGLIEMESPNQELSLLFKGMKAELLEAKAIALPKSSYYLNSFK